MTADGRPAAAARRLFVYGTLKRGGTNHRELAGQHFLGMARSAPGYRLYHLGEYPGLVPDPADQHGVVGEVWQVSPAALAALDAFEGVPEALYRRATIPLLPPFAGEPVDTYFYRRTIDGCADLHGWWPV